MMWPDANTGEERWSIQEDYTRLWWFMVFLRHGLVSSIRRHNQVFNDGFFTLDASLLGRNAQRDVSINDRLSLLTGCGIDFGGYKKKKQKEKIRILI